MIRVLADREQLKTGSGEKSTVFGGRRGWSFEEISASSTRANRGALAVKDQQALLSHVDLVADSDMVEADATDNLHLAGKDIPFRSLSGSILSQVTCLWQKGHMDGALSVRYRRVHIGHSQIKEDRTGLLNGAAFAKSGVGSIVMAIAIPLWPSLNLTHIMAVLGS